MKKENKIMEKVSKMEKKTKTFEKALADLFGRDIKELEQQQNIKYKGIIKKLKASKKELEGK